MPTFQPATDEQLDQFLQLMHAETFSYLTEALAHMQMTWEQYAQLFKTRGQVYAIYPFHV